MAWVGDETLTKRRMWQVSGGAPSHESNGGTGGTFLFADLAGFTALTETHGDAAAADLVADFCELARGELAAHGAEEVKLLGDAILFRVLDPGAAIRLGLTLSARVAATQEMLSLRVGMHTGSAVERAGIGSAQPSTSPLASPRRPAVARCC